MSWIKNTKKQIDDALFDHPTLRKWLDWGVKLFVTLITTFLFAWGFRAFINPTQACAIHWVAKTIEANNPTLPTEQVIQLAQTQVEAEGVTHLISGGASGTSQAIVKFISIFADTRAYDTVLISILYFLINVPLIILAWRKISKQFTVFTLINVACVSLFNYLIPDAWVYNVINLYNDMIARCLFGGIMTGFASGAALAVNTSAGGTDIISLYLAEKRSSTVGKFALFINGIVILSNVVFGITAHFLNGKCNPQASDELIRCALYTFIYLFTSAKVIDLINIKNRKQELQIFTSDDNLPLILVHAFPHSATVVDAKGAFTGQKRLLIHMVVSKKETAKAVEIVRQADSTAFVTVLDLNQVYGRFYIRPID